MKLLFLVTLLFSISAGASVHLAPKMIAKHLAKKLIKMERAFAARGDSVTTPYLHQGSNETAYYLKRIRLQFAPFVAFDIKVFEAKIIPIFEFRWTRKNPTGWSNFKRAI